MKRLTHQEAESLIGRRLDRRRAYYFNNDKKLMQYLGGGPVFTYGSWTQSCSGCFETEDGHPVGRYPWDKKHQCYIGAGCSECGYTGKRRDGIHTPVAKKKL